MKANKRIIIISLCLALLFITGGEILLSPLVLKAEAAATTYSSVLDDFKKDPEFDPNDYPAAADDYSLKVIQIAEGENGDLFLYVYQPSDHLVDLKASYINFSDRHFDNEEQNYSLYSLKFLNSYGTIDKYLVEGFEISSDKERFYNIAGIYREFRDDLGDIHKADVDDKTGYKCFPVGKCFGVYCFNDELKYELYDVKVVDAEIVSTGIVRYNKGYFFNSSFCDSHFIAFKVNNFEIDEIFDATVRYTIADYVYNFYLGASAPSKDNEKNHQTVEKDISYDDKGDVGSIGILGYKYEWPRIQTFLEFDQMLKDYSNEQLIFEGDKISSADYVFSFLDTDYSITNFNGGYTEIAKRVTDVSLLRLHFATKSGDFYNLGVVSDIVSDDGDPDYNVGLDDNFINSLEEGGWWTDIMMILGLIVLLLIISIFTGPIGAIFKLIWNGIKYILQCFLTVITAPFKFLESYFKSKK